MPSIPIGGRQRVIIERISPEIDGGQFAVKRTAGDTMIVEADIFADGHDVLSAVLQYRQGEDQDEGDWVEISMTPLPNDRWRASFSVPYTGNYYYSVEAWIDEFKTWRRGLEKKSKADQDVTLDLQAGHELLERAVKRATPKDASELQDAASKVARTSALRNSAKVAIALSPRIAELMAIYSDRKHAARYHRQLRVVVDPELARFGSWYEMFPRSCGTLQDCERMLARISEMGFDILYLPPIHPIGLAFRKGKNNNPAAGPDDVGSPWGIGSPEGGHKAVNPALGTLDDFRKLVDRARELDIEIALDIAIQCSPDHPYVKDHPDWFKKRPDGSIQYAENPPKKYQDIYPIDFETEDWRSLWLELKSIFEFWIVQGVRVFRVDNPHTKSFRFWEWCIGSLKKQHPDLIFLSEAFTRPKVMHYLAKLGFTQSYNYFPWRNTKRELTEYFTELTQSETREYFHPNLWPNTPDILTQYLQYGGRPAFMARLVLAATLGASYGIYGPAFELCENRPRETGSEEYLDSEKYQIRKWNLDAPGNLTEMITRVNRLRRENPALQSDDRLHFHPVDNEQIIAYSKHSEDLENIIVVVINLDPHHTQAGWLTLALDVWKMGPADNYQVHDLLTGARFLWTGARNYVELNPAFAPAHILRLRRRVRTEYDFDYFI